MNARKGDAFIFLLNILFLLAVILIFSKLHAAFTMQNANEGIGTRQAALLHTYATSEQMLLYVDEAARFAAYESLATAMEKGGQNPVTPKCPEVYAGYRQWTRAAAPHDCLPNATVNGTVYEVFKKEMMLNTKKYLANYPGFPLGITYDIILKPGNGLTVIGLTKDHITLPIVSAKDARQQAITPLLQDTAKSELDFKQDTTLTATVVPSVNRKARIERPTNITIQSTRTVDAATALKQYTEGLLSTHYLIDEQGMITQLVPEDQRAFLCDTCGRIEEASIIISLVNKEPVAPVDGKCQEGELLKDDCRTCQPACYVQYTKEQISTLKELLTDIVNRHDLPVQNINLQGKLLGTDNPGPALREGAQQSSWFAQLLIDIAADKAKQRVAQEESVEERPVQYQGRNQVIQLAEAEWQYFSQGSAKECSIKVRDRVEEYFEAASCPVHGVCGSESDQYAIPWSAAFISYTMRNSNVDFPYSCSHFDYFTKIRDNPDEYQCTTHRMSELSKLQPGDLLCTCRDPSCVIRYEDPMKGQSSHCDIVTEVTESEVVVIGGNVGNSVMKRRIAKSSLQRYFGFISCGGGKPACGMNSMPLDAAGDDDVTATLAKIRAIEGLEEQIKKSGEEHGVDPKLMIAQIAQESDGNTHLVSIVGALGISQFMPETARQYYPAGSKITTCGCAASNTCKRADPSCAIDDIRRNPHLSVEAQAKLMADNIKRNDQYTDKIQFALAEYNWGGRIRTVAIPKAKEQTGKPDPSWQDVRPYTPQETQNYVDRIMRHYASLGGSVGSFQDMECENFFVKEMGTYSFAPSFTTVVPDLLTAVNRTAEWAQETYEACDGESDNRRCLHERIEQFNTMSQDLEMGMCEDPVQAAMNELQQVITDCKENRQDDCGCVWRPQVEMQILITGNRQQPVPVLYTPSDDQLPTGWIDQEQPLNRALLITTGQRSSIRISDAFGKDAERVDVDALRFVKNGNQMMLSLDDAPHCGVYKTTHQVCAQVRQRIPILSRGAEFETPKIKFALYLNDSHAPDVTTATIVNITGALVVTIVHPADDVSYYKIACSATPSFGNEVFVDARRRNDNEDSLINPFTTTLTTCNGQPIVAEQTYYVRIAAVDISGNRGDDAVFQTNQIPVT